jgi:hypothetical protein
MILFDMCRMEDFSNESLLEGEIDVKHRAYMMSEKNMVIIKRSTQMQYS